LIERTGLAQIGYRLEKFVKGLFQHHGFIVEGGGNERDFGHDFTVHAGSILSIVEVKLYTSMTPASRNIAQALTRLERQRSEYGAAFGILATNSRLLPAQKRQIEQFPRLRIYDFDVLSGFAFYSPTLALDLEDISRSALVFRGEALPTAQPVDVAALIAELGGNKEPSPQPSEEAPTEPPRMGAQFCAEIHNVNKSAGKPFETACEAAIRWLFGDELVAFDKQHGSHTGHNIFDLVARIASKEDFWQALITDFRARYIVFEFKNYSERISQREIYTTEKYLYPVAMRGAAIIVSPHGADEGADKAMRGALRESGKLILSLSVDELCDMLRARDSGSDHLAKLVAKLDEMLMGLER
jgi:hypothetical protein